MIRKNVDWVYLSSGFSYLKLLFKKKDIPIQCALAPSLRENAKEIPEKEATIW